MPDAFKLFVNYRRADHPDFVEHMRAWFIQRYGRDNVFMDFDSIPEFKDFESFIKAKVRESSALVMVIGPQWLELLRQRKRDGQKDYVLVELKEAIQHGVTIAPICIQGASVPDKGDIPAWLRPVWGLNFAELRSGRDIIDNIEHLMDLIEEAVQEQAQVRAIAAPSPGEAPARIDINAARAAYLRAATEKDWSAALVALQQMREAGQTIPAAFRIDEKEARCRDALAQEVQARQRREVADYLYGWARDAAAYGQPEEEIRGLLEDVWAVEPGYDPDGLAPPPEPPPQPPPRVKVVAPPPEPAPLPPLPYEPEMVRIPAGPFLMGSPKSDELRFDHEPEQFQLDLNYDYAIGRYPVTVGQYRAFVEAGGYHEDRWWTAAGLKARAAGWDWIDSTWKETGKAWTEPRYWKDKKWAGDDMLPVVGVSWYEAYAYTRWLAEATGRGYRLPTEAEWEKAARGGLQIPDGKGGMKKNPNPARRWPWGDEQPTKELCNFDDNVGQTSPVTSHAAGAKAQPYGLYHMAGNVWEWCLSKWADPFVHPEDNDPEGDALRVLRGGSWFFNDPRVRCSYRLWNYPRNWAYSLGFRVGGVVPVLPE